MRTLFATSLFFRTLHRAWIGILKNTDWINVRVLLCRKSSWTVRQPQFMVRLLIGSVCIDSQQKEPQSTYMWATVVTHTNGSIITLLLGLFGPSTCHCALGIFPYFSVSAGECRLPRQDHRLLRVHEHEIGQRCSKVHRRTGQGGTLSANRQQPQFQQLEQRKLVTQSYQWSVQIRMVLSFIARAVCTWKQTLHGWVRNRLS